LNPRKSIIVFMPALIWAAIVLYIGGRSSVPAPKLDLPIPVDKIGHFTMYGILGLLAAWGVVRSGQRIGWGWLIAGGLLLGAIDEYQQTFIPTRTADPMDWVADAAGFTFGFWLVYGRARRREDRGERE